MMIEQMKQSQIEYRNILCNVYVGPSGSGKSKIVREIYKDIFTVNTQNRQEFLFNNYNGEKTILFDDFYGGVSYHYMLAILDGYRLPLNIKNGDTVAMWDTVIFTSNKCPELWWENGLRNVKRRITNLWEVREGNTKPLSLETQKKWE